MNSKVFEARASKQHLADQPWLKDLDGRGQGACLDQGKSALMKWHGKLGGNRGKKKKKKSAARRGHFQHNGHQHGRKTKACC